VILEVSYSIVDDLLAWGTKLGELPRMGGDPVTQLGNYSASFSKSFRGKGRQLIAIFGMTCKREHFAAQPHEPDPEPVVPPHHLDDVSDIGKANILNILAASLNVCRLVLVGPVLGCMFWLGGVFQRMSMLDDAGDSAGPRTEDGRIGISQIGIQASLIELDD
jgi:hypothetical protein